MARLIMTKESMARIAVFLVLIFLIGMQVVRVAEANPFWIFHPIEPIPGTIPPKITIFSPQNNTAYPSDNMTISFYVDKPKLDMNGSSIDIQSSSIINITYTLDDRTEQAFTIWKNGSAGSDSGIPNFNTSLSSPALSTGNHYLTVYAEAVVFAGGLNIFFINSSSTVFFATHTQTFQPSPTPSPASAYSSKGSDYVSLSIIQPRNLTYNTNNIQITLNAQANPGIWYVGYSLDDESFKEVAPEKWLAHTFNETISLNGLSEGSHILLAQAKAPAAPNDILIAQSNVSFTIFTSISTPSPIIAEFPAQILPVTFVVAVILVMVFVFKRRKLEKTG